MVNFKKYILGSAVVLIFLVMVISGKYLDLLWYQSMGAASVFWIPLITGPLTKITLGVLVAAFLLLNVYIALKSFNRFQNDNLSWPGISANVLWAGSILGSIVLAFILTAGSAMDWTVIQQFLHPVKTGVFDPVFRKDLGFYLFTFPLLRNINNILIATTFLSVIGITALYVLTKAVWRQGASWEVRLPAKIHITVLTTLFLAVKIWGYTLNRYSLLFQESSRMTGINYTAAHSNLLVLQILIWVVAAIILLLWTNLLRKNNTLLLGSLGVWLLLSFGLGVFYPGIIQSFVVKPNEYELEASYLQKHIRFTRQAYNLDQVKIKNYSPAEAQTAKLKADNPILADLRLWDYRPLQSSYNQLQSIRPYYHFMDIDIDRYPSNFGQRQIMLSARELIASELPDEAKSSWINLHLTYTHGYGFAANQVNQFTGQGQPVFISRDLPPKTNSKFAALKITRPEIYYSEQTDNYVVVKTRTPEFDYPKGNGNTSTTYRANNGIKLDSFFIKLLMMLKYRESNFILSSQLTPDSRVLMDRNILQRVRKLAPFLTFDQDPYLVVVKGKLYWIIDAYTTSAYYPYSRYHSQGFNYIRNSVKTIIDAYDGTVRFYVNDSRDPVIQVWQKVFPGMLESLNSLDKEFVSHFRYPEDLMNIQCDLLSQYHMTNPKTFYAQEDSWNIPVHNNNERFQPYYVTLVLPGEQNSEFALMQPFSPRNKQNLSSWLIARCDPAHYGELLLYTLPKDQNIYGPAQIDSRINQDQTISQLITLWNQNQSRILWGDLLIIPVENSILYVKPLFIESEQSQQAELKKIVMVYQNQVVIGDTVEEALNRLSLVTSPAQTPTGDAVSPASPAAKDQPKTNRKTEILRRIEQISRELQQLSKELNTLD
jgi:uncharacterized membrane protein (UPF0182 family)